MRKRARGLDRPAEASCDYKKREHKTEYKTLSRSVFCKIRIQDFTDRLQGSGFYRKQILTAVCTLFSVLVFCNMKRPLYYKKQEGPCITVCNMGVSRTFTEGPCITICNMGVSCTFTEGPCITNCNMGVSRTFTEGPCITNRNMGVSRTWSTNNGSIYDL